MSLAVYAISAVAVANALQINISGVLAVVGALLHELNAVDRCN